jgi:ribosomal subunit interface protein
MNINIKATNMELTPAIKDFIEKKIKGLEKFIGHPDGGIYATVEVGMTTRHHQSGNIFRAEIQIDVPHLMKGARAESLHADLYTAIEDAKDLMKLELSKGKEKKISLARRGARAFKRFIPFLRE